MAIRFRKSIKIAPGLKINISKSGVSLSAGSNGITATVNKKGVRSTASIPGSGLSSTKYTSFKQANTSNKQPVSIMLLPIIVIIALVILSVAAQAHPGRTDKNGCHNDRKTGTRHCH